MGPNLARDAPTARALALAARQHGVLAVWQLRAFGVAEKWTKVRHRQGWLRRVHRGVYAVGPAPLRIEQRWTAAVLACGPGAVLSHRSAGALWQLLAPARASTAIEVTDPTYAGRSRRTGLIVHRSLTLRVDEIAAREGIPVTTPARTLLDLAAMLSRRELERAGDEGERLRLCGPVDLAAIARAHWGHAGAGRLKAVLASHAIGSTVTRSELEERFLGLCRRHRLPQPKVNEPLLGYVVDFLWPGAHLIVEVDGRAAHGTSAAFQRDRDRDSRLTARGYRTLRFTWWDLTRRPAVVADRVRRSLRAD